MPILDNKTFFCDATSIAAAAGTVAVGTVLDCNHSPSATRNLGAGRQVYLVIQVTTAVSTGSSPTVDIQFRSSDNANLTSSPTTHYATGATAAASLTTSFRREIVIPVENYKRFIGIVIVTAVATTTTGAITAYLTDKPRQYTSYDDNVSSDV